MASVGTSKRLTGIVFALILAAVATIALLSHVRGVEARAMAQTQSVEAFVAKDVIPTGMPGEVAVSNGLIERAPVARQNLVEGAITSLEQIQGRVAAAPIMAGEQIHAARFIAAQDVGKLEIPEDRQAMSLQVGIPPGVAGHIKEGDRISVVAQLTLPAGQEEGDEAPAAGGAAEAPHVQYLLQDVEVLSAGKRVVVTDAEEGTSSEQTQKPESEVLLTLALTPDEVEKLAYGIFNGQLYLTLLAEGQEPVATEGRTADNVFDE